MWLGILDLDCDFADERCIRIGNDHCGQGDTIGSEANPLSIFQNKQLPRRWIWNDLDASICSFFAVYRCSVFCYSCRIVFRYEIRFNNSCLLAMHASFSDNSAQFRELCIALWLQLSTNCTAMELCIFPILLHSICVFFTITSTDSETTLKSLTSLFT